MDGPPEPIKTAAVRRAGADPDADFGPQAECLRGIVFDVPDVLYDATLPRRWLFQLVTHLGIRVGYQDFCRDWDAYLVDVHCGRRELAEALESFLLAWGLSWAQVDEIEAASRLQQPNLELGVRPLPGVVRTLDELSKLGLPLVAWADAPHTSAKLAERLEHLLPRARFAAALTSFELECGQPAAECYQAAIDVLGLPASRVLYVGHDASHLAGAQAAGLRTVAFNFEPQARADHYLTRFEELLDVVRAWPMGPHRPRGPAVAANG